MRCPSCGAEAEADAWDAPERGAMARATLTDWRTWAIAFAIFAVAGGVGAALGYGDHVGVGGGAGVGAVLAMRMTRLRVCRQCRAVVHPS